MKARADVHYEPPGKTLPLTSENLKKFERQFKSSESLYSQHRIPRRTAADGKSAENSVSSAHDRLKKLGKTEQTNPKTQTYDYSRSLYRPVRDTYRKNPEGRSQNGSAAVPFSTANKIYYDEGDDRIPYEDPDHVVQSWSRATNEFVQERFRYESSSYSSSAVSVVKAKKPKPHTTSDGSVPSSTSASSSEDDLFDDADDDDDTSSEDHTTTITKQASTTFYTRSSSIVSSISSIPTIPSSDSSTNDLEAQSIIEHKEVQDGVKNDEVAPPLIDMKKTRPISRRLSSELSISLGNFISSQCTSRKDSVTSAGAFSRQSYVTIRNWTRWGTHSIGGYSITDKIIPFHRRNKSRRISSSSNSSLPSSLSESSSSQSDSTVTAVRSASSHLPSPAITPTLKDSSEEDESEEESEEESENESESEEELESEEDTEEDESEESEEDSDESSTEEDSDESSEDEQEIASIGATPSTKNERPAVEVEKKQQTSRVSQQENHLSQLKSKSREKDLTSRLRVRRPKLREKENDVEGFDFKNRTKKIPKLRDRPPRPKGGLGKIILIENVRHSHERKRKRKGKNTEEIYPIDQGDARPTFTSLSYTPPLHRKPKLSLPRLKPNSSLSTSSDLSLDSRASSAVSRDSFPGRRRKTVLRPLNVNDSGFATDCPPSSCDSIRPTDTPFTPVSRKISGLSLRSLIVSDDSGCSSDYRESDSCLSRSSSSCISSDGESTVLGPDVKIPPPREKTPVKQKTKELPPVRTVRPKILSPYNTSMMPLIIERMKVLRDAIKRVETKEKNQEKKRKVFRVNHPMPSFTEAYRDVGMERLIKLAKPKESKAVWATSFWPVRWGDQTMVFPMSKTAMRFQTTPRLVELAVAKKDFRKTDHADTMPRDAFQFSCGRSSVILEVSPLAMKAETSKRVTDLAKHKTALKEFEDSQRTSYIFSCGRSSPIWDVSEGAKTAEERERTMQLAAPKKPDPRYQPERSVTWPVSQGARRASPSPRTEMLARPKTRADRLHREPTWRVSSAAMRTVASARVQELSKPKQTAEGYEHCREIAQPLPRSVLRATATERIKSLSKPNVRETMDHVQFNPDAFKVSETALKGRIPDRIADLAQPLSRN